MRGNSAALVGRIAVMTQRPTTTNGATTGVGAPTAALIAAATV